ncbi:MAG: (Fe-S)-binding protein [Candidatus Firestonebacteria bacterium]
MERAKDVVKRCLKCGFCVNQCPVYKEMKEEAISPRAKIRLIKAQMDGTLNNDRVLRKILNNCLMCETCFKNCPSGLHAADAIADLRVEFRKKYGLDWKKKLLKAALGDKRLRKLSAYWARIVYNNFVSNIPLPVDIPAGALKLSNIPKISKALKNQSLSGSNPKKVLYFVGCVDRFLFSDTAKATIKVLNKIGFDVEVSAEERCCGIPLMIGGDSGSLLKTIRKNVDLFTSRYYDYIVSSCPTCIVGIKKNYGEILKEADPEYYEKHKTVAGKMLDFTSLVARNVEALGPLKELCETVTYHDPCHLANSLGVTAEPRKLIKAVPGVKFKELRNGPSCCGSGGFYHVYFPEIARKIGKRKSDAIAETGASVTLTACPACKLQLINFVKNDNLKTKVMHIAEYLSERM